MTAPEAPAASGSLSLPEPGVSANYTGQVPATNDPTSFVPTPGQDFDIDGNVWPGSELDKRLERGEYIEGWSKPAEVPAGEGTLALETLFAPSGSTRQADAYTNEVRAEFQAQAKRLLASGWFATELQKARAEAEVRLYDVQAYLAKTLDNIEGIESGWTAAEAREFITDTLAMAGVRSQEPPTGEQP